MLNVQAAWALLAGSVICVSASQLLVKWRYAELGVDARQAGSMRSLVGVALGDWGLWVAGFLIVAGAGCWYAALTRLPLSLMLPIAAIVSPLVVVGAHVLLGEKLTGVQVGAVIVIALGVATLASQR